MKSNALRGSWLAVVAFGLVYFALGCGLSMVAQSVNSNLGIMDALLYGFILIPSGLLCVAVIFMVMVSLWLSFVRCLFR